MTVLLLLNTQDAPISVKRYERREGGKVKATHSAELPVINDAALRHLNEFLKTPEAFEVWKPDTPSVAA